MNPINIDPQLINPQQFAIIDMATRVIKRITIDPVPSVSIGELAIPMVSPITLNGYQVLGMDNVTLTPATQPQIDSSGVDEVRNGFLHQQNVDAAKNALLAASTDPLVSKSLQTALAALELIL